MTPGSGNQWHTKNDVRTKYESIECKTTTKKSYSLKEDELVKAQFNAAVDGRDMRFKITFSGSNRSYIVMPESDYLGIRETMYGNKTEEGSSGLLV